MTVLDDFKTTSIVVKIAFILLFIASLFTCISYTTTSWGYDAHASNPAVEAHYGLWRLCQDGDQPTGCTQLDGWANDWYGVVQAFVTIGFFGTLVTFLLIILYIFVGKCQKNGEVGLAAGIVGIFTGLCYLIGIIVFGAKWDKFWIDTANETWKLGYSFALSVVALGLEIIGGILMIVATKVGGGKTQSSA